MTFRAEDFFLEAIYRPSNLVLALNMEENPILNNVRDTTKIKDLSSKAHHGALTGTTDAPAKWGRGRSFNGTSDVIQITDHADLKPTSAFTSE